MKISRRTLQRTAAKLYMKGRYMLRLENIFKYERYISGALFALALISYLFIS